MGTSYQVDEEVLSADQDALLTRLEAEAAAHLEQEGLESVHQRVLQVRLADDFRRFQAEELERTRGLRPRVRSRSSA